MNPPLAAGFASESVEGPDSSHSWLMPLLLAGGAGVVGTGVMRGIAAIRASRKVIKHAPLEDLVTAPNLERARHIAREALERMRQSLAKGGGFDPSALTDAMRRLRG